MSGTLDKIKNVLQEKASDKKYPMTGGVYYGACSSTSLPEWNYFVFNRKKVVPTNHNSYTDHYEVRIIHEDYIAEGYDLEIVKALKSEIPGFSLSEDVVYDYVRKGETSIVVEICTLTFKQARKVDDG